MRPSRIILIVALVACAWNGGAVSADSFLRTETKRTVVTGYTVQGGFALPVTTTVTTRFGLRGGNPNRPARSFVIIDRRRAPDRFAGRRSIARSAAVSRHVRRARSGVQRPRLGPRTTTVFGTIQVGDDGILTAVVKMDMQETVYYLEVTQTVRKQIDSAGVESFDAIIIGKIRSEREPRPLLKVASVLLPRRG